MRFRAVSLFSLILLASAAAVAADSGPTIASWQPHKVKFFYRGLTSHYTCEGLEQKVKYILLHLGARKDAVVHASGCMSVNETSPTAWVDASFYTLATTDHTTGADAVRAGWTSFVIAAHRPNNMGEGECELIEQMKAVITDNFALRDLNYRATCTPHQVSMFDYSVSGKVLQTAPVSTKQ